MIVPGRYYYEIRRRGELIATEEEGFSGDAISGIRRPTTGSDVFEANAKLDQQGIVVAVTARYSRGPFSRNASYEADSEFMRGSVSAMGGRTVETAKLGRYREVDAGLVLFRTLMVAHTQKRGQSRWTSRVVAIEPSTLVAHSQKQTLRRSESNSRVIIYEPRMGDSEEIEADEQGRIVGITDNNGLLIVLKSYAA